MTEQDQPPTSQPRASLRSVLSRGLRRRCPRCGSGRLFRTYLKQVENCSNCNTEFGHIRADDIPAYFTILLVGHVVVPLAVTVEQLYHPDQWVHMAIWIPLTLVLTFGLLPLIKGAAVGVMWRLRISGNEMQ